MNDEREPGACLVLREGKYGILLLDNRNWAVGEINLPVDSIEVRSKDFNTNSYTYHASLRAAVINMANRMLRDRVRKECKNKPLEMMALANLIRDIEVWRGEAMLRGVDEVRR